MIGRRGPVGRLSPTRSLEWLLVAALGAPDQAAAAWRELPESFTLDELEPGSFELLPLIYRNLAEAGIDDPIVPRLKGVYRRSWVKNSLLLERTRDLARALQAAVIPALFLEGPTFAARYYPDLGLRPTSTIHLQVHRGDCAGAVAALTGAGWATRAESGAYPGWRFFFDDGGNICLLGTTLAFDFVADDAPARSDTPLWEAAVEQDAAGATVRVPAPTDALLAVCVAGLRRGPLPRAQWIADAAMLLRTEEVDWDRILEIGVDRGQTVRLRAALSYLRRLPVPEVPTDVLARLAQARPSRRERLVFALASGSIPRLEGLSETVAERLVATGRKGTG